MTGLFLISSFVLAFLFLFLSFLDDYNDEIWGTASRISFIIGLIFLIAIPISRIETRTNVEYLKTVQLTLDANRENPQDLNVFERSHILEEINTCNKRITAWRVKGQKWYNNKWYLDPTTQDAVLIK